MTFLGTREDALQRLPPISPIERLELGKNRITLVDPHQRIDMIIHAEECFLNGISEIMFMLIEFSFKGKSEREADDYLHSFRFGHPSTTH